TEDGVRFAGADRSGNAHVAEHQVLARSAGRSARRAEKQRRFALVVFGGPQITAERQVTLKQRLQIIERCAAGVVAERASEVSRGRPPPSSDSGWRRSRVCPARRRSARAASSRAGPSVLGCA